MSTIILGPKLIGKEASERAQRTAVDDAGGGAIQVGPGLLSKKKFGQARDAERAALAAAGAVALAALAAPAAAPAAAPVPDLVPPHALPVAPPPVSVPGLSEDDVEIMLAADPNSWDVVAEAEAKRAEGWRPRVARMLYEAAADAKEKPMAPEIKEELKRIAQVGLVADAEKLRVAVNVPAEIGTGFVPDQPASD